MGVLDFVFEVVCVVFSECELVDLMIVVGFMNIYNCMVISFCNIL